MQIKFVLIFVFFPAFCFSQPLTEINTKEQAEQFIVRKLKYNNFSYKSFIIESVIPNSDCFKKADFDNDGIEDLLVFGIAQVSVKDRTYDEDEIVVILGDKKRPRKLNFPYSFFRGLSFHFNPYPKVISFNNRDYLLIQYDSINYLEQTVRTLMDTLFVEYDHLIPYNPFPSNKIVTRIDFKTDYCYGTCPVFEISIDRNLDATYNGFDYVDRKGEYKLKADEKDWEYLSKILSFINVEDLKDSYKVNWTDDQTAYLTVHFQDGSKKDIRDYGLIGTLGLSILYKYFFELIEF